VVKEVARVTAEQFGHIYIDGVSHNPAKVKRFLSMGDGIHTGDIVIFDSDSDHVLSYIKNAKYAEAEERKLVKQFVRDRALAEAGFDIHSVSDEILSELAEEGVHITSGFDIIVEGGKVQMNPIKKDEIPCGEAYALEKIAEAVEDRLAAGCQGDPSTCGFLGNADLCLAEWSPGSKYHPFCPKRQRGSTTDVYQEDLDPELVEVFTHTMKKDMSILIQSSLKAAIELYKDVPMSPEKRHAIKGETIAIALWIDHNSTQVMEQAQDLYNLENKKPPLKKEAR
jgi:hypothetical protein